jgi:uncharacterized damage-inducible protein DinB
VSKKIHELVDALAGMRQALFDSVSGLSEAQLDYKPDGGEWAISDILHHLALTDEANMKLMGRSLKQADAAGVPPDPTPDESVLNCLDAYADTLRNTRAQAPEFVRPQSRQPVPDSIARLEASREKIMASIEKLGQYDLSLVKFPHPLLGELNLYQWIMIAGGHERRHTAQIGRIKSQPGFPQ